MLVLILDKQTLTAPKNQKELFRPFFSHTEAIFHTTGKNNCNDFLKIKLKENPWL